MNEKEKEVLRNLMDGKDLCFEEKYTELESKYYNFIDIIDKIIPIINEENFSKKDINKIKTEIIRSGLYEIKDNKIIKIRNVSINMKEKIENVYKYRVKIIESERGWGQRIDEIKYFVTEKEAQDFVKEYNKTNDDNYAKTGMVPDWYMQAEFEKI
jgi:hypothetical protein